MRFQEQMKRQNAKAAAESKQNVDKSSRAKQLADQKAKLEARRAKAQKGERRG